MKNGDNRITLVAISLVSYVCADVAHHVLGHGAACLLVGGHIDSLSSIVVRCSITGSLIDLAGPAANLAVGLMALLAAGASHGRSAATRLAFVFIAAFNLLWFAMQLVFSAATRTDDWAWSLRAAHASEAERYCMIGAGVLAYAMSVRIIGAQLVAFAVPKRRLWVIVFVAWLSAGAIACATALFDRNPGAALRVAVPQSMILSLGILYFPIRVARIGPSHDAPPVPLSKGWLAAAIVSCALSLWLLGPGIGIG